MNAFALSGLFIGITSALMGIFVYLKNPKSKVNQVWLPLALSIAVWGWGGFKIGLTKESVSALFWWRIAHIGVIFIPVVFLHFVYVLLEKKQRWPVIISYILGIFFLITNLSGYLIKRVDWVFNSFYYDGRPPTILYILFTFLWAIVVVHTHRELFISLKRMSGVKRNQVKYFFLATVAGFSGGTTCFLPVFGINLYPYGNFTVPLYPLIMAYAIIRYRLMDIKVAITRTGVFILVYTVVLGLPFWVTAVYSDVFIKMLGKSWWVIPSGLIAALATVGPFIYIFLQQKAEGKLLKTQKTYQQTLRQASVGMTRIRDFRRLLDLITHIVTSTVRISYIGIYLYDEAGNKYLLQASRDKGRNSISEIDLDNTLILWIKKTRQPLIYEEVKRKMQEFVENDIYKLLEQDMQRLTAAVVVPSFLEDRLMGLFVLGDKNSGDIYTTDDLNVFQILASQSALAIENARFYDETKKMYEQASQAEKMATIGTMADGLSHQINNRFHAIALIAADTVDSINFIDTANCSDEIKELFKGISYALKRIEINVIQGGQVVSGILRYTRKGAPGMEPLTVDQVLDATLEMVQYKVKLSEFDLVRDYPKDTPKISGNLVQLQEVFFNFIDNAYDAINERRTLLKEEGYRGRITVSARVKDEPLLEITIEDNGLGVRNENIKKVFTPFFTTKLSSRKGTGLGLYVIKRIITENHQGSIFFESDYKVGTRFIVDLPLAG